MGAPDLDQAYIDTFEQNVVHLAQQYTTKLRGTVQERGVNGNSHSWETLDAMDVDYDGGGGTNVKGPGLIETPNNITPYARRISMAETIHNGTMVNNEDIVQMLIEPKSTATRALAMGMNRAIDDVIITAATGTALDGDGVANPLPAESIVGDGTASISFDFITEVQERFMQADIDPAQPKVAVIGPTQVRKLLQLTEQTSADYVSRQALQQLNASGIVMNWMGFTWIMSTRLNAPDVGELDCLFYTPDALGLQINEDITLQVAQDPSASFDWRLYSRMTIGCVRVQDEKFIRGHLLDSL